MKRKPLCQLALTLTAPSGEKWILTPAPENTDDLFAWMDKTKVPVNVSFPLFLGVLLTKRAPVAGKSNSVTVNGWKLTVTGIKK